MTMKNHDDDFTGISYNLSDFSLSSNSIWLSTWLSSQDALSKLFQGLGRSLRPGELENLLHQAGVDHDQIDFADFLGLAREHLELSEVIRYLETTCQPPGAEGLAPDGLLGHINTVHSEAELYGMIGQEDAVVKLAFTWCRPCKAFLPRYEKFAKRREAHGKKWNGGMRGGGTKSNWFLKRF